MKVSPPARALLGPGLLLLLTGIALVLRLHELGGRSLWVDEAMSVVYAAKPVPELLRLLVTEDIHPPLYPLLLHYWMALFGDGEVAVRLPSLLFGVALVPLIYATGRRLERHGERREDAAVSLVGLAGGLLAATSVYYVVYSQEARSYTAVTFMGLLSSHLLLRAMASEEARERGSEEARPWIAYAAAMGAALYTHYTAFLLLPFHLLFVLLASGSRRVGWRPWALSMLAVVVAYLPWAGYCAGQVQRISDYWSGVLQLDAALRTSLLLFVAGGALGPQANPLPLGLGLALLAVGLFALALGPLRRKPSQAPLFLLLYLVVPSALLFAVAYYRPKFDPRYLLVATPAFYLILAWGIALLLRPALTRGLPLALRLALPTMGVAALVGVVAVSAVYGEPERLMHVGDGNTGIQQYGDYRALVAHLESRSEPGDAVVLMMNANHPYQYYGRRSIPWYPMEPFDDFDGAIIRLNRLVEGGYRRLWFILWQREWADPADYVMYVMETQAREIPVGATYGGLGLRLFSLEPGQRFSYYPRVGRRAEALFDGRLLEFWGWNQSSDRVAPGGSLRFDLHWIMNRPTGAKLKTKVMLMDSDLRQYAAVDEIMVGPFYPAGRWRLGQITPDRHVLKVPPATPPGTYDAQLLVYDENSMTDLVAERWSGEKIGTLVSLGKITVVR